MRIEWHGPAAEDHFTPGRSDTAIDRIVIHTMVGWIASADATFKGGSRLASAHYGVRMYDVPVWQWVQESDTAWHAGDWDMNLRSIGIEHEDAGNYDGVRPDILYATSSALVRDICQRYGIPVDRQHILAHREVSSTRCPDALDIDRIVSGAVPPAATFPILGQRDSNLLIHARSVNPAIDPMIPALYMALAPQVGVLPEVAFAQALHETSYFTFPGTAQPDWHNPAGIGVTGGAGIGNRFADWQIGIRAHLGHLLWYFGPIHPVAGFCDRDPRHFGAHKNYANDLRQLNGHWAVPGTTYGESIYEIVAKILVS